MSKVPTPADLVGVSREREEENRRRQRDAEARRSRERADAVIKTISTTLRRDGISSDGLHHTLPESFRYDHTAVNAVVRELRSAGWIVIEDPDDEDDIGHGRPPARELLIRLPSR